MRYIGYRGNHLMSVVTEINEGKNLIIHHFSENISLQLLADTIKNTVEDPKYKVGMNAIWSCDEGTVVNMTSEETQALGEFARQAFDESGVGYKLALVASDDLAYGMARVYEGWSNDRAVDIKTFRKLDEAVAWME